MQHSNWHEIENISRDYILLFYTLDKNNLDGSYTILI
jgi:hypothetical protein